MPRPGPPAPVQAPRSWWPSPRLRRSRRSLPTPLPGEGQWRPLGQEVHGQPGMYVTYLRPDPVHTSLLAAVAWIDPKLVRAVSYAGAVEPGGTGWAHQLPISPSVRPDLLAVFNSGFKMEDAQGGYYDSGRYARPLRVGAATLWITSDGVPHVGQWGRDGTLTPNVVEARQNLDLIVDGGQPAPGVQSNDPAKWGWTLGNKVLVWRSRVGETANGALVYVGGPALSVYGLAELLVARRRGAGHGARYQRGLGRLLHLCARAVGIARRRPVQCSKLLVDMNPSTSNYLSASSRDGIAFFAR